jgi:dienelactone hydrolase
MPTPQGRTSAEIRASIEETRRELSYSVNDLQSKVKQLTNWRAKLAQNQQKAIIGAAVAGFVIGGGIAALGGLRRRRRG